MAYPAMLRFLPAGFLGFVVAACSRPIARPSRPT
jgi:hypothetical protein